MSDHFDWVLYHDDKGTEAEIMPRLVEEFRTPAPLGEAPIILEGQARK
jgi:hypothetical protein